MLRPIEKKQLPQAKRLLENNGLPLDGFPKDITVLIGAFIGQDLIGCAGLEIHGEYGLLRSVVVTESHRGKLIGEKLTQAILAKGASIGLHSIYLLTETATGFFPRHGFEKMDRSKVPEDVKLSVEFTTACPESAISMAYFLDRKSRNA